MSEETPPRPEVAEKGAEPAVTAARSGRPTGAGGASAGPTNSEAASPGRSAGSDSAADHPAPESAASPSVEPGAPPGGEAPSPDPVDPAEQAEEPTAPGAPAPGEPAADLEELPLPSLVQAPAPLSPDRVVDPEGRLRLDQFLGARGRINYYAASWTDVDGKDEPVELREGLADDPELIRESDVLGALTDAMLPRQHASFVTADRRYLALDRLDGPTLAEALDAGLELGRAVSIVLQLIQVTRRLHRAGWALVGLAPGDVRLSDPIRVSRLTSAVRIGERPERPLQVAGYSAPALARNAIVTGQEDVFTLGAILYRALTGRPLSETGVELSRLPTLIPVPGMPQILASTLASPSHRLDLESFYAELVAFKQRQERTPVALDVASATTIGLNPGRPVNEDSSGYLTWAESGATGTVFRALLCIADGMGGMEAGEVASGTALGVILSGAFSSGRAPGERSDPREAPSIATANADLRRLIEQAARAVYQAAEGRQVGTTVTCVAVNDGELTLAHVGDTRAYLLRAGTLTQLTADHSLVAAMVASGVLTREEARGHPDSNQVLRALGSQRTLPDRYVDTLEAAYGQPSTRLQLDDWLVLCTDGIWGQVDDEQIRVTLEGAAGAGTAANALIDLAIKAEAPDNATAIVARVVAPRDR